MKLQHLAIIRTGLPLNRKRSHSTQKATYQYNLVTLRSFSPNGHLDPQYFDTFYSEEPLDKYTATKGDILLRLRHPIIAAHIVESYDLLVPAQIAILKVNPQINAKYLAFYLNSKITQKQIHREIKGTLIPMIHTQNIRNIEVVLPTFAVQNKIADFLDTSNQEINLLKELITLKTALTDQIFTDLINKELKQ